MKVVVLPFVLVVGFATIVGSTLPVHGEGILGHDEASQDIAVRDLRVEDNTVSGVIVNKSLASIGEIRLLIRQTFLWKRERIPGKIEENPGRSFYYTMPDVIPPGGVVSFQVTPRKSLPDRKDGRFETHVEVVSYKDLSEQAE